MAESSPWTENPDGTYSCVACGCAPFKAGRHCECPRGVAARPTARQVEHLEQQENAGPPTIDDYERELYALGREDADLTRAFRACRAAARSMYHGGVKVGHRPQVVDVEADDSPRYGYECQRDSIRLRLMALDSQVKHNAERRKRLETLYQCAIKRSVIEAVKADQETARILRSGRRGIDAN